MSAEGHETSISSFDDCYLSVFFDWLLPPQLPLSIVERIYLTGSGLVYPTCLGGSIHAADIGAALGAVTGEIILPISTPP